MISDAVVIGAGQAGLAAGFHLQRAGLSFRILEASERAGGAWRDYYDSLTLFSPAAYSALPGLPFPGAPNRYPRRDEVVQYLEQYRARFALPVESGRNVVRVTREDGSFDLQLADGDRIAARKVIVASGAFGAPHRPATPGLDSFAGRVLHSCEYRSASDWKGRRIVVIGGANSAVQIADELAAKNRVTLATRRPIRFVPQRVLGKDFHFWMRVTGLDYTRWLDDQSTPVLDDGRYRRAVTAGRPDRRPMFTRVLADGVEWADGSRERVDVLLFATGFRPRVPFLAPLDALGADGRLRQRSGISTAIPGLYYVGFPKQRNFASATLRGVGPDAAHVVNHLARGLNRDRSARRPTLSAPA